MSEYSFSVNKICVIHHSCQIACDWEHCHIIMTYVCISLYLKVCLVLPKTIRGLLIGREFPCIFELNHTVTMMTSSNGNILRVTSPLSVCAGNSPVPVNSRHKCQWRGALMFSFICVWMNDWVNNREAGDLRRHRGHYDVNVMTYT